MIHTSEEAEITKLLLLALSLARVSFEECVSLFSDNSTASL